jgi:RNA polymerase sigma-70 factor (ECF subfamily)
MSESFQTSASLLERLRGAGNQDAWSRFVQFYGPLLNAWANRLGFRDTDAADLIQEVLLLLLQKLPAFEYDQGKRFRGWLWTVVSNKANELRRRKALPMENPDMLAEVAAASANDDVEEREYQQIVLRQALQVMQSEFEPTTWKACWEVLFAERSPAEVAAELGISVGAVYVAKSRVLQRLRLELAGLIE